MRVPLCVLLMCLQCGEVCNAIHAVEMVSLQVEYGESVILPCNGSAYLEEDGGVQWEAMGEDVAILRGGELRQGDRFKGRVQLPSEEKLREGDWSVVLEHTILSDTDMYQCILQGRKTMSTVWLTVKAPHVERSLVVPAGDTVDLPCYIQISRSQSIKDLQVWWTKNGSNIVSSQEEASFQTAAVSDSEEIPRVDLSGDIKGEFHLSLSPAMMSDNGEYRCLYKTRDSDDPRPGIPESITLTVLENPKLSHKTNPTDTDLGSFLETTSASESWTSTSHWLVIPRTEEVADVETTESPLDLITVSLEDSTPPIKVMTDPQPMVAFEEMVTSLPEEATPPPPPLLQGTPETSAESLQRDTLPWIRIGLIAGVLLATTVVLCILGALRQI
ncbi:uncharacterized protein [Chaetodon trifascialis]|uniref:uncharacterized protein n=1 Tax=Chaetodon trifascialis TaxID=109706 RepID=UPI0039968BB6